MSEQDGLQKQDHNRRKFLKYTGYFGTLLSAGTLSSGSQAKSNPLISQKNSPCDFSQLADDFVYLNTGTEGSMPSCVLSALQDNLNRWASKPTNAYETDKFLGKHQHYNRAQIATFLAVNKNNITLTDNTTMGLSMVLMGLNFKPDDTLITTNHEHTAIASPLAILQEKLGLTVHTQTFPATDALVQMTASQIIDALFPDCTQLRGATALCVSHVYPTTGIQLPLNLLRKKADALGIKYLILDGAQAIGMLDLSQGDNTITHADFYACPGHKWLNGPPGTGVLYIKNARIRPPEFYPILSQRMGKYATNEANPEKPFPMAEALQVRGNSNAPGFAAMVTAVEYVQKLGGAAAIEQHIMALSQKVKNIIIAQSPKAMVSPYHDESSQSGLTVFHPFSWQHPDKTFHDQPTADYVVAELIKKNIKIRSIGFVNPNQTAAKVYLISTKPKLCYTVH
jgi:selenocysteine lyase/cysteine desulfurase